MKRRKPVRSTKIRLMEVLKDYMWANHRQQREIAKEIGCSTATLGRFVNGTVELSSTNLANLLTWLLEEDR